MQGIYFIKDKKGRVYVGSSVDIDKRFQRHFRDLEHGNHHNLFLQRAYNKHGKEYFEIGLLEEVTDQSKLFDREQYYIDTVGTYNMAPACGGDLISNHPNKDEIIARTKATLRRKYRNGEIKAVSKYGEDNPNWRGGISNPVCPICGSPMTQRHNATCAKCRDRTGEHNPFYNKHHSEDTKRKISESHMGIKPANTRKVIVDGVVYDSMTDAGKAIGCATATVMNRIRNSKFPNYDYA